MISDLLDAAQARSQLAGLRDATHVVYCAFQSSGTQAADFARGTEANLSMLANAVNAIDSASSNLQRVVSVTGNKYYAVGVRPPVHRRTHELGPVVVVDPLRQSPLKPEPLERGRDVLTGQAVARIDRQAFTSEEIDHRERSETPAVR